MMVGNLFLLQTAIQSNDDLANELVSLCSYYPMEADLCAFV